MQRTALILVLVSACKGSSSSKAPSVLDRAARVTFALGSACCDAGTFKQTPKSSAVANPDANALLAVADLWTPISATDVDVCGQRMRPTSVMLTGFHGKLAQAMLNVQDCAGVIGACMKQLGEPTKRVHKGTTDSLRYANDATIIFISSTDKLCAIALQDAKLIAEMEAKMDSAVK